MADDKDDFSTEYDDLDLDLDIMGDEGDLMDDNGSRRPSAVTKEFFSGALSGLGQGMKKVAADEFARKFPVASQVKSEVDQTYQEFQQLKSDLAQQLQPMLTSLEDSATKLLPKAKKLIPSRLYDKISKKLDARAKARREEAAASRQPSKEEYEAEMIAGELSALFGEQTEYQQAQAAEQRQANVLNQALEATRAHKLNIGLGHIYESVRWTEQFHRTTHTAYMKKSLELKYKHLFATRDIFNLIKQQTYMQNEYLKGIAKNTSLPEIVKEKPLDYVYHEKTKSYGTKMAEFTGNFRRKLFQTVKQRGVEFIQNGIGGLVSNLQQAADAADMAAGIPGGDSMVKGMAANTAGSQIMSAIINNTIGGAGVRAITDKLTPYTQDLDKTLANVKTDFLLKLNKKRQEWMAGGGGIFGNLMATVAGALPGMEALNYGTNDLLTKGNEPTAFDKLTRQSIVEIIPGFLGKILQSIDAVRTGEMQEETVYDIRSRAFTSVSKMKETAIEAMFGEESVRQDMLGRALGTLKAGYATEHTKEQTDQAFKNLDKDIYRVLLNHAIHNLPIDPLKMRKFATAGGVPYNELDVYTRNIINKVEHPVEALRVIADAVINQDGAIDSGVMTELKTAIFRIFDSDAYKEELPKMFEDWGQRRFFQDQFTKVDRDRLQRAADAGDQNALKLLREGEGLIQAGTNKFNLGKLTEMGSDMDYSGVSRISRETMTDVGERLKNSSELRKTMTANIGSAGAAASRGIGKVLGKIGDLGARIGLSPIWLDELTDKLSGATNEETVAKLRDFASKHGFSVDRFTNWTLSEEDKDAARAEEDKSVIESAKSVIGRYASKLPADSRKFFEEMYDQLPGAAQGVRSKMQSAGADLGQAVQNAASSVRFNDTSIVEALTNINRDMGDGFASIASLLVGEMVKPKSGDQALYDRLRDIVANKSTAPAGATNMQERFQNVDVTETDTSEESIPGSNPMLDEFRNWREEYTSVTGTLFDAIMHVAEKVEASGSVVPGEGGEAGAPKTKKPSFMSKLGKGVVGATKFVANKYAQLYGGILKAGASAASYVGKGLMNAFGASPYLDIYVKGEIGPKPLVTWKQQAYDPGIVFADTGKRVGSSKEIDRPCIDPRTGNIVISEEDIKKGLVTISNNPIGSAMKMAGLAIGGAAKVIGKGYFQVYAAALKGLGKIGSAIAGGLFGSKEEQFFDVYLKDRIEPGKPLLSVRRQEEGVFFENNERVIRTKDINKPVFIPDKERPKCIIGDEELKIGLVDINNKPISKGHSASEGLLGKLGSGLKALGIGIGKTLPSIGGLYADIYKGLFDLGKKGISGIFGKLFGAGKGSGQIGEEGLKTITTRMDKMIDLLGKVVENTNKKKKDAGDKDGDGIVDGSYADQMKNKKEGGGREKADLDALHKDVDHAFPEEGAAAAGGEAGSQAGGGSKNQALDYLKKTKFGRNMKARLLKGKRSALRMGKNLLTKGKGLGKTLLSKGGSLMKTGLGKVGTFAKPLLGKAGALVGKLGGGTLMKGAGMLAGKLGLGTLLGGAGTAAAGGTAAAAGTAAAGAGAAAAGGAGLAGLAGAALPAAAVAAALYGGYRMAKGFTAKETMDNLGIEDERDVLLEDRLASALGFNTKIGAKAMRGLQKINPIIGLIKGIRGNDNPMTPEEVEQGRAKLQRKAEKGLPGYDKILDAYEKALEDHNWSRARQLCGKEADGVIASMWKHSITGKTVTFLGNLIFGDKDKPMEEGEIEKVRAKFNSMIEKGNKKAEKLLDKFEDYVAEGNWKKARELAGMEKRGLFGALFQDSQGNVQWGKVAGAAVGGVVGYGLGWLFSKKDPNEPMSDKEVEESRAYLQKLIDGGNKKAEVILEQFDEAVTEMRWKKARALVGKDVKSNLEKTGRALKTVNKWSRAIGTLGLSLLFDSDQETPMDENQIKKFTDKMNFMIEKGDKRAQKKLDAFQDAVAKQDWEKARRIANMPHESLATRGFKANLAFWWGNDDKEMTPEEIEKARASMQRKIDMGQNGIKKKLDAFEDAVGRQNWRKARAIADMPDDGVMQKTGKLIANQWRFWFGGDGKPMDEGEIEKARKRFEDKISDGDKTAQKRLDAFNDAVADEKWERARQIADMPYENIVKRAWKSTMSWLTGDNDNPMDPKEIERFQGQCEQRIADGDKTAEKVLEKFNEYVEGERWNKARELSGFNDWGVAGSIAKAGKSIWNFFTGGKEAEDCDKLREEIEQKAQDDESGMINRGLDEFETLYRRQKYKEAYELGQDLMKLSPKELKEKHGFSTDEYEALSGEANKLVEKINKKQRENNGWLHPITEMKLAMLRRRITGNPDQWSTDFLDKARSDLSAITGEDEFAEDYEEGGDDTAEKARLLIEDSEKALDNCSAWKHPIDKAQLAGWNLLNKAQAPNMSDEELEARYKKMETDFGDYFKRSTPAEKEKTEEEPEAEEPEEPEEDTSTLDGEGEEEETTETFDAPPPPEEESLQDIVRNFKGDRTTSIAARDLRGVGALPETKAETPEEAAAMAPPPPVSSTDMSIAASRANAQQSSSSTSSIFQKWFGGGQKTATSNESAMQMLVKQNQQLLALLGAVMSANGVKVEGMEALAAGLAQGPSVVNNVSNASTNDVNGLDFRKA